jgi:hypothetical protein
VNNPLRIIFLLMFGVPIVFQMLWAMIIGGTVLNAFVAVGDRDGRSVENTVTSDDISFGGDIKKIKATLQRLRNLTANVADARTYNRSLVVAVVSVSDDRPTKKAIELDLANAHDGAILLIANRPVVWSTVNVSPKHRAKIAIEGSAVFDMINTPPGILAGFRVSGFGAANATNARDVQRGSPKRELGRFCNSIVTWAKHYQVVAGNIRVWRIDDPERISLFGESLSTETDSISKPELISDICKQSQRD